MLNTAVERRLYTRVPNELPVKIYYGDVFLEKSNTINLSVGGLLIRTKNIGLTENSLIQIMFDLDISHCLYNIYIPAVVRRSNYDEIAVAFENLEKGIEEFIYLQ
ncbi:PilZ domain-containing protein [Kaarinaea lacus]